MKLLIHLKKENNKATVLYCTRENNATTYAKLHKGLEIHDIAHYIVEQHLGFKNAFYGLLSKGYAIEDFQLPKKQRSEALYPKNLHHEALVTEHIVNLLQTEFIQPEPKMDILKTLKTILSENELPFPTDLTTEKLLLITEELKVQMVKWNTLASGEKLELIFEV